MAGQQADLTIDAEREDLSLNSETARGSIAQRGVRATLFIVAD